MLDYSTLEYWEQRFSSNEPTFDWLKDPKELLPIIRQVLKGLPEEDRRILHIGSGSSTLSLVLRELVQSPSQVHNVDFSNAALDIGRELESSSGVSPIDMRMVWTRVDLLDTKDILSLQSESSSRGAFNMVVDKSTSDAIACGEPVELSCFDFAEVADLSRSYRMYPVWRLALHMAILTEPGALWVALSYKEDRFCFFDPATMSFDLKGQDLPTGLLPRNYWILKSKQFIVDEKQTSVVSERTYVHRPTEGKWLFVLQRTEKSLSLKGEKNARSDD